MRTGVLAKRATGSEVQRGRDPTSPSITRPLEAPRSTAATLTDVRHDQRRNAAATPASTGMCRPVVWVMFGTAQREDGVGAVLGQDLALEQRALGVELAEVLLVDAVDGGALRAPAAGEDAGAADDAVGVDAVDLDAVLAELGGQQPHLVGLVGLHRGVGDVVGAGEDGVLGRDVDDVAAEPLVDQHPRGGPRDEERALGHHVVLEVPVGDGGVEQRLGQRETGVVDDQVEAAEGEHRGVDHAACTAPRRTRRPARRRRRRGRRSRRPRPAPSPATGRR